MATLFFGLLFLSIFISGSRSELLVKEAGTSVQMQIQEANFSTSSFDDFYWKLNKTKMIIFSQGKVKKLKDEFKDRMEFSQETFMLTLNKLKKTDSGLYEATASAKTDRSVAEYSLSVMDPVDPPVLTHVRIADPCNITLTCRGHDLSINSSCYNETCEEKNVTSSGGVALSLSVRDGAIICNHSNPVSWKQDNITFTELCPDKGTEPPRDHSGSHWTWFLSTVCIVVVLGILFFGNFWIQQRRSADTEQRNNALNAGEENLSPASSE